MNVAVIDVEATGLKTDTDRIITLSVLNLFFDQYIEAIKMTVGPRKFQCNPGVKIPEDATKVHGITDEMVKDWPSFKDIAPVIHSEIQGAVIAGFAVLNYDIPILSEEFARCDIQWPPENLRVIDSMVIYKRKEERGLAAALVHYCGKVLENAHDSDADVMASKDVMLRQLRCYDDFQGIDGAVKFSMDGMIDFAGKFKNKDGVAIFNFGKHFGTPVSRELGMLEWMLDKDFPANTKRWARKFLINGGHL